MAHLTLRQKLWIPLLLTWVGLLTLTVWYALQMREMQLTERKHALADVTEMACSIETRRRENCPPMPQNSKRSPALPIFAIAEKAT